MKYFFNNKNFGVSKNSSKIISYKFWDKRKISPEDVKSSGNGFSSVSWMKTLAMSFSALRAFIWVRTRSADWLFNQSGIMRNCWTRKKNSHWQYNISNNTFMVILLCNNVLNENFSMKLSQFLGEQFKWQFLSFL